LKCDFRFVTSPLFHSKPLRLKLTLPPKLLYLPRFFSHIISGYVYMRDMFYNAFVYLDFPFRKVWALILLPRSPTGVLCIGGGGISFLGGGDFVWVASVHCLGPRPPAVTRPSASSPTPSSRWRISSSRRRPRDAPGSAGRPLSMEPLFPFHISCIIPFIS